MEIDIAGGGKGDLLELFHVDLSALVLVEKAEHTLDAGDPLRQFDSLERVLPPPRPFCVTAASLYPLTYYPVLPALRQVGGKDRFARARSFWGRNRHLHSVAAGKRGHADPFGVRHKV
jgi:hypothetical protein